MFVLLAHAMRVSAIVVLLLGGVLVGPYGLNLIAPDVLGEGLKTIIGLSVGLILFAITIVLVGCHNGLRVEGGSRGVGLMTTRSVVMDIFFIGNDFGGNHARGAVGVNV